MTPPSGAHAILAHYFCGPGFPPAQGALTVDEWQRGLDAYGTRLISANEWIARCLAGTLEDAVTITFDDGLLEAYVLAKPALDRRGLTAAWNVYTGPYVGVPNGLERARWLRNHAFGSVEGFYDAIERQIGYGPAPLEYLSDRGYLSHRDRHFRYWRDREATPAEYEAVIDLLARSANVPARSNWMAPEDLRDLASAGHVIGIHTHSHPTNLDDLSHEHQALEYATAREILDRLVLQWSVRRTTTVSHPCGRVSDWGLEWLREHGFTLGWGATMDGTAPWTTPRWSTGYWRST